VVLGDDRYLGYLQGAQAENAERLTALAAMILNDHAHWRRNYFPDDLPALTSGDAQSFAPEHDALEEGLRRLLARLRRSFPFHSPRYIAHQQSEVSMPSLLGGLAGMLYNANNVTSESGNATLPIEDEVSSLLLGMLGFTPPPPIPSLITKDSVAEYERTLNDPAGTPSGWCHLTSGGTSANIEGLWVARNVTYQALALRDACLQNDPDFAVTTSAGEKKALGALDNLEALNLSPREAARLLPDLMRKHGVSKTRAWLRESRYDLGHLPTALSEHPPVILVAGTAHYSIHKATELLGIGTSSLRRVATDMNHRLDIDDLRKKLEEVQAQAGRKAAPTVLAVVVIVGTTEEGSVDPLHEVVSLREEVEKEQGQSFWIHADGAWGAYFRSLLRLSPAETLRLKATGISKKYKIVGPTRTVTPGWVAEYIAAVGCPITVKYKALYDEMCAALNARDWVNASLELDVIEAYLNSQPNTAQAVVEDDQTESEDCRNGLYEQVSGRLQQAFTVAVTSPTRPKPFRDIVTTDAIDMEVLKALDALSDADSVTLDPHKLGYQHYACGAIAFRDARTRHYVVEEAPYITQSGGEEVFHHLPLSRLEKNEQGKLVRKDESPARYTLEGSRASHQATALWLSTTVLPLDQEGHGALLRASFLAARQLFHLLMMWHRIESDLYAKPPVKPAFQFVPLALDHNNMPKAPDTNIVIFGVKPAYEHTLEAYNNLTSSVYRPFRISAEAGEHQHSYSQPFFLSQTTFSNDGYPAASVAPIAAAAGIQGFEPAYTMAGAKMMVLRATVVNPYLIPLRERGRADLLLEFVKTLAETARANA